MVGSVSNPNAIPILDRKGILDAPNFPASLMGAPSTVLNTGLVIGKVNAAAVGITNAISAGQVSGTLIQIGGADGAGTSRVYIASSYIATAKPNVGLTGWIWSTTQAAQINPLSTINIDGSVVAATPVNFNSGDGFTATGNFWIKNLGAFGFFAAWNIDIADSSPSYGVQRILDFGSLVSDVPQMNVTTLLVPSAPPVTNANYVNSLRSMMFEVSGDVGIWRIPGQYGTSQNYVGSAYISTVLGAA